MNDYIIYNRHTHRYIVSAQYKSYWKEDYVVLHDQIDPPPSYEKFEIEYCDDPNEAQVFYSLEKVVEYVRWLKERTNESWAAIELEKAQAEYLEQGLCL